MPLAPKRRTLFPSSSINALPLPNRKVSKNRPAVTMALRMVTPIRGSTFDKPIFSRMGVDPHNKVVAINRRITTYSPPQQRPVSNCFEILHNGVRKFHLTSPPPDLQPVV